LYAAVAPDAVEVERLAQYLVHEAAAVGVKLLRETIATPKLAEDLGAEVAVMASGAKPVVPGIPGSGLAHVFAAPQLLEGEIDGRLGRRMAVIGGGLTEVASAKYLLGRGHEVSSWSAEQLERIYG
jgi:pyruvate/2-oxoglutarate dehydrogenase complex dihydrolipoamide dehydrogenase (E3) component